jgi:glycerol uptake facilitator-like aquaporin
VSYIEYGDLFAWAFIIGGGAFALSYRWMPVGAAIGAGVLAALLAKSLLLELV